MVDSIVVSVVLIVALRGLIWPNARLMKWPMYSSIPLTLGAFEVDGVALDPLVVVSPSWDFIGLSDLEDAFDYLNQDGAPVHGQFTMLMPNLQIEIIADGSSLRVQSVRNV